MLIKHLYMKGRNNKQILCTDFYSNFTYKNLFSSFI